MTQPDRHGGGARPNSTPEGLPSLHSIYPPRPTMGTLRTTVQGNIWTSTPIPPTVTLNGYRVLADYGVSVIPVPAGRLHIEVYSQWARRFGQAALDCVVPDGQTMSVFYAPPYHHQFTTGDIGHRPMPRRGLPVAVVSLVLLALATALFVVAALLPIVA